MACVPILGRMHSAGVFPLDACMNPIYGPETGVIDDCFAALDTSDNMDEGEEFTRRCANGTILYYEEGEQSLQSVEVNLDLNAEPSEEWMASVGLVQPVLNGEDVIGYTRCTKSSANLLVAIWQEVIDAENCTTDGTGGGWRLHLFPLRKARLTIEGGIGAEDSYVRITGATAQEANLGKGPIPLLVDPEGVPVYPSNDLLVCHHTVLTQQVAPPPEECGVIDTVDPDAVLATGATAGTPGVFTPEGSTPPADLEAMDSVTPDPATPWAGGEYVILGDGTEVFWDGTEWVAGS